MQKQISTQKQAAHKRQFKAQYKPQYKTWVQFASTIFSVSALMLATPAYAGLTAGTNMLNQVVAWLGGLALGVTTIVIMWNGYKVMTKQAQFTDLASVFIGAVVIGAAGAIALIAVTP